MVNFLHWLFGWEYILFSFGRSEEYRRVRTFPNGIKYVKCYGAIYLIKDDQWLYDLDGYKKPYIKLTGVKSEKQN